MRPLPDMNVKLSLAASLRAERHDAAHLHERGSGRLADPEVFALAIGEARSVVTSDLDFGEVLGLAGGHGCGVALLRLRLCAPRICANACVWPCGRPARRCCVIVLVEDSHLRIRQPPL